MKKWIIGYGLAFATVLQAATVTYDFNLNNFSAVVAGGSMSASGLSYEESTTIALTSPRAQLLAERSDGTGGIVYFINQRSFSRTGDVSPMTIDETGMKFTIVPASGDALDFSAGELSLDVAVFSDGASVADYVGLYAMVGTATSQVGSVQSVVNSGGTGSLDMYEVGTTTTVTGWALDPASVTDQNISFDLSGLGVLATNQAVTFKITGQVNKNNTANFNSSFDNIIVNMGDGTAPTNTPPVGNDDAYSVVRGNMLETPEPGVLVNDEDANGEALTALLLSGVSSGSLNFNPNGSFGFTPAVGFTGTVSFTYAPLDGSSTGSVATATIQVYEPIAVERPNILIFFADDMGRGDSRIYNTSANLPPEQPTIEAFAASGMVFSDAHTQAALCAPSRYCILTGNYPWRGRLEGGSWHMNNGAQVMPGQQTLAHVLNSAGYDTSIFGKGHLGGYLNKSNNVPDTRQIVWKLADAQAYLGGDLSQQDKYYDATLTDWSQPVSNGVSSALVGFDYSYMLYGGIQDPLYAYFENDYLVGDPSNLEVWDNPHFYTANGDHWTYRPGVGLSGWYTCDVGPTLTQKTLDFIDAHVATNQVNGTDTPFFIHYCAESVHTHHTPPIDFLGTPVEGATPDAFADMLYEMNVSFSNIIHKLEVEGLLDNTLVIFTSDNGGLGLNESDSGHNPNEGLRGYKASIWEGGHAVPMFIKWGDKIPAGQYDHMVGIHDLYATIAQLVGKPQGTQQGLDAVSLLSVLLRGNTAPVRENLLCRGNSINKGTQDVDPFAFKGRALREGSYKLIWDLDNDVPLYLYDLATDPAETNDLLNDPAQAARVARMTSKMVDYVDLIDNYSHPSEAPRSEPLPSLRDLNENGMDDDWETDHFGSTNAVNGGASDDYDLDGINNLLEFAFGSNPTVVDDPATVFPNFGISGETFEYVYRRRQDAASRSLFYTPEQTPDLVSNLWSSAGLVEAGVAFIDADTQSVTNHFSMAGITNSFFHLKVEAQ